MNETWAKFFLQAPGASYIAQGPQKRPEFKTYFLFIEQIQNNSIIDLVSIQMPLKGLYRPFKGSVGFLHSRFILFLRWGRRGCGRSG